MEYVLTSEFSVILDAFYFFQSFYGIDMSVVFIEINATSGFKVYKKYIFVINPWILDSIYWYNIDKSKIYIAKVD